MTLLQRRQAGFTLVELLACLVVVALLAAAGWPGWSQTLRRHQVQAAAGYFEHGLAEARHAAARSGQARYLVIDPVQQCQAVVTHAACSCHEESTCLVKMQRWPHGTPVQVKAAPAYRFEPAVVQAQWPQAVLLQAPDVAPLAVRPLPLGRASVCAPAGGWPQFPGCG